jgi:hypothetical protein
VARLLAQARSGDRAALDKLVPVEGAALADFRNSVLRCQPILRSRIAVASSFRRTPADGAVGTFIARRNRWAGSQGSQPLLDRGPGAVQGGGIPMKLESPICAQAERMDLEGELGRVGVGFLMSGLLRFSRRDLEGGQPVFHQSGKPIANWPGMTVELR